MNSRREGELFPLPETPSAAKKNTWVTAYCDGGSRGNPGPAGYGVYVEDAEGRKLAELNEYLGKKTNNFAEYSALLAALDYALQNGIAKLRVIADSELLVKQIQGKYRVNSTDLRPLYEGALSRIRQLKGFEIQHVLREKNRRADQLANLAMDKGMGRTSASLPPSSRVLRGFVKGGAIHLLEGELPEGIYVKILPEYKNS